MVKNLKKRENKMIDKIKTINNYKLLARLHALNVKKENENNGFNPDDIDKIITNFKISYPNIDTSDLREVYEIPNGDSTYQQIRGITIVNMKQSIMMVMKSY